jgi:HSP20 family protein
VSKSINPKTNSEEARQRLLKDFQNISEEMENLMQGFFSDKMRAAPSPGRGFSPPMDVFETEDEIICLLDLVGVGLQDLEVHIEAGTLRINGVRRELPGFERRHYHKMELDFGAFGRSLTIPEPVEAQSLKIETLRGYYLVRLRKVFSGLKPATAQDAADEVDTRR